MFLRRVASVWEVKERLDLSYNDWLIDRLRDGFKGSAVSSSPTSNNCTRLTVRLER